MPKPFIIVLLIVVGLATYYSLAKDLETSPIWQAEIDAKIFSDPLAINGSYIFWGGNKGKRLYKLFAFNSSGEKIAESQALPHVPFNPILAGNKIIMADHGRMLRAFEPNNLNVLWEAASAAPFEMPPLNCGKSSIIQAAGKSIFCFDSQTGKQLWDITLLEPIKNYACDKVVIAIHGHKDLTKPMWKCSAYDLKDGLELWSLSEYVSSKNPLFIKNNSVLTTAKGELLVVDQLSGKILLKSNANGYIAVKALEDTLLLTNENYDNLTCLSLINGKTWSIGIKKDFIGAAQIGSRVIIADKESLRCLDLSSGNLVWQKDLGDIYAAYPHRGGIFVTYKESFSARTTYATVFGENSKESLWLTKGNSIFKKPHPLKEGDLLLNYEGTLRLMPKPVFKNTFKTSVPDLKMPDLTERINQAFEARTAKEPFNKQTQENLSPKMPLNKESANQDGNLDW